MHLIKTAILKSEMLLEFMSCVISVTFIQKTYENNSVRLHNAGSPYAMFAYSALKEILGKNAVL